MTYVDPQKRKNAEENGIPHAPEKVIAEWHSLAETVCRELRHAGLPAYTQHPNTLADMQAGACVSVDTVDGPAGGVHVSWNAGETLTEAALGYMEPDRLDLGEPVIEHGVRVGALMDETIRSVLTLAGFRTCDAVELNDLAPGTHVAGRQPRQWFIEYILTEGVLGLIATIRSRDPSGDNSGEPTDISVEGRVLLTARAIRIVQDGLHRLTDDDRQESARVFRRLAGAMHSQDMVYRGFWKANRSLLELPDELCLPTQEPPAEAGGPVTRSQVLVAAYLALLGSIELADEDTVDEDAAVKITEAWTGTLLRRLDEAPDEDRQELVRLFREAAREETNSAHKTFASGFPEAIGLVEGSD
ncbi:hypothetical protein [Streptomyces sp. SID12488]|uniref:hypothetical protein n=1 Tax=Streptomyces sp. SID12488 TaxID=2706040 RepID=UPI0013DBCFCA|nr:hypothetical protein [Streptomyces sp. SID12488]NEA63824.1 hypothetical protein [Streptomyces sp. SID12488]